MSLTIGQLSGIILFLSGIPYAWEMHRGKIKDPPISSWSVWTVMNVLLMLAHRAGTGATLDSTLFNQVMSTVNVFIILCLALRTGSWQWKKSESVCTGLALASIALWQCSGSAFAALFWMLVADFCGTWPMIQKTWTEPDKEPFWPWFAACIAHVMNLFAAKNGWELLLPIYFVFACSTITLPLGIYSYRMYRMRKLALAVQPLSE